MHYHGVVLADTKVEHHLDLRPLDIFAGGSIDEGAIQGDLIELPPRDLIEGADSNLPDALPCHATCDIDLSEYKGIVAPWNNWRAVQAQCTSLAAALMTAPE